MPERCPLSGGRNGHTIDVFPEVCSRQCANAWNDAVDEHSFDGDYDEYYDADDILTEACPTRHSTAETAHELLWAPNASSKRLFAVIDGCETCGTEIGSQTYTFDCPYN